MPGADLESRVLSALRDSVGLRLCVAYSGGLDSTVLLHLLARLAPEAGFVLSACHIHHGLSARADAWAAHCEAVCKALGVSLRVMRVSVSRDAGKGLEAAARAARHAALAQNDADWIVLAHHADDQAETVLFRLLRGAGVAGAAGMRGRDPLRRLWRPLLGETRATLEAWAAEQGLAWVEDDSNPDQQFSRNFVRHVVLAPLTERFPSAGQVLARAAGHFAEAEELLGELAALDAARVRLAEEGSADVWRALSAARGRNLLRYWLAGAGELAPDAARLEHCRQGLAASTPWREIFGATAVCAYRQRIWLEPAWPLAVRALRWQGEAELGWAGGRVRFVPGVGAGALRLDPLTEMLMLAPRVGGERLRLAFNRPTRQFKQLCQEAGLPLWWRDALPLLWRGDELVWLGGVGGAAARRCEAGESGWRIEWQGPDGLWR